MSRQRHQRAMRRNTKTLRIGDIIRVPWQDISGGYAQWEGQILRRGGENKLNRGPTEFFVEYEDKGCWQDLAEVQWSFDRRGEADYSRYAS